MGDDDDDLAGLDPPELLALVVRELRALRRLVGTVFLVSVALVLGALVVAAAT
jgi:hypothetical protein